MTEQPQPYDPGAYTVAEVQDYVTANPDQAAAVRDAEAAGKARSTLLAWLDDLGAAPALQDEVNPLAGNYPAGTLVSDAGGRPTVAATGRPTIADGTATYPIP